MSIKSEKSKHNSSSNDPKIDDTNLANVLNEAFDNGELSSVGQVCQDTRLKKGLTSQQVSASLMVKLKVIEDFEDGNEIDLPNLAYKVGFVRSYTRFLGLDSNLLVEEFKSSLENSHYKEQHNFLSPINNNNKILPVGTVISLLIATLVYSGWYYSDRKDTNIASNTNIKQKIEKPEFSNNLNYEIIEENFVNNTNIKSNQNFADKKEILVQNESVEPIKKMLKNADTILETKKNKDNFQESTNNKINELSAKANIRDPKTEMVLKSSGNSWVEIEDMNGSILFARLMRPGETFIVPNINGLTINTGNAGVLSLSQGNSFLAKLGEVGEIITAKPLNIKSFSNITNIN
jgi:cytoskeleton protein RodZ